MLGARCTSNGLSSRQPTLGDAKLVRERFPLLNRNHTLLPDLLHRLGNQITNMLVSVGGNSSDLRDFLRGGDGTGIVLEERDDDFDGLLDTAAEVHGVDSGSDVLQTLGKDGAGEN